MRKVLPLVLVVVACGSAAGTAQAMTISLGTPSLTGRVSISEPVTVACTPFDPSLTLFAESVNVSVEQASGRSIARGSGSSFTSFPCDGNQYTIPVGVLADTAGPPFHGGTAVFTASAGASAGTPCGFSPGCFTSPFDSQSASEGPMTLGMH
jgi:hypothetical protein